MKTRLAYLGIILACLGLSSIQEASAADKKKPSKPSCQTQSGNTIHDGYFQSSVGSKFTCSGGATLTASGTDLLLSAAASDGYTKSKRAVCFYTPGNGWGAVTWKATSSTKAECIFYIPDQKTK